MSNNKDFKVKNGLAVGGTIALGAIDTSISDTATAVFVYDTSKDSDGGAWRKRCQHTSWYNETLNTSTRGSRKEFPSVAVIVAESNKVTIYDGDDPSMPMWMVFSEAAWNQALGQFTRTAVTALNGIIVNTSSQSGAGGQVNIIQFIDETILSRRSTGGTQRGKYLGNIAERNAAKNWDLSTDQSIVNQYANDCAMTVLPNAPIDSATNLPIPTIAVATDGGVSVIKDDGSVVDITGHVEYPSDVHFNGDKELVATGTYDQMINVYDIPTADITTSNFKRRYSYQEYPQIDIPNDTAYITNDIVSEDNTLYLARQKGLVAIDENKSNKTSSLVSFITSDYNTGWMNGDIKLAALSDTDDTDVTGSELIANYDFSTTGNWTLEAGWAITGGELVDSSTSGGSVISDQFSMTGGKTYVLSFQVTGSGGNPTLYIRKNGATITSFQVPDNSSDGVYGHTFTVSATGSDYDVRITSGNFLGSFDFISVRLAEQDRSVNNNGLQVHGTIDKDPVATGAELVAYSGFSTSNYLQQPHQSYMDDVSGNWTATHWGKVDGTSGQAFWEVSQENTDTGGDGAILTFIYLGALKLYMRGNSGSQTWENTAGFAINDNAWHQYTYTKVGNVLTVYQDGVARDTKTLASDGRTYNEADSVLRLGGRSDGDGSALTNGAMALFRFSATVPTAEQIAKIYEDEKPLFQEGAKATLYGTSDAVTALAHDDDTNLLHVGTSAGRSVFQGLRRVSNTTDAVGTCISASNDLVAEE